MRWLTDADLQWTYENKKLPCAPTLRFPDFVFVAIGGWVVILEVDENEHRYYLQSCEIARLSELMDSISCEYLHVIRFNPHGKATKEELIAAIREAVSTNYGVLHDTGCAVQYIGYSEDRVISLDQLSCDLQKQN